MTRGARLSLLLSVATAAFAPSAAQAQYYVPSRVPPSVELNLDVLEEAPATTAPQEVEKDVLPPVALTAPAPEPVAEEPATPPLVQPFFTAEPEEELETVETVQTPRASRPFFTTQAGIEDVPPAPVRKRPQIAKTPRPKQAIAPVEPQPRPMVTRPVERLAPAPQNVTQAVLPTAVAEPLREAAPPSAIEAAPAPTEETDARPSFSTPDATLAFSGQESTIGPVQEKALSPVLMRLTAEEDTRLQLRAYAAGDAGGKLAARRISLSRALAVRTYLMEKGIRASRIDVRAMGSETEVAPADRVDMIFTR